MKKTIRLENLDCANCAAKVENAISKLEGVEKVSVNFMAQKMVLEVADEQFDTVFAQAQKVARKIEPDLEMAF